MLAICGETKRRCWDHRTITGTEEHWTNRDRERERETRERERERESE